MSDLSPSLGLGEDKWEYVLNAFYNPWEKPYSHKQLFWSDKIKHTMNQKTQILPWNLTQSNMNQIVSLM